MYASELPLQQTPPLPLPLTGLLQQLLDFAVQLAWGVSIGLVLCRLMHSRGLRWSWSLPGLALVSLLRELLAGSSASGDATVLVLARAVVAAAAHAQVSIVALDQIAGGVSVTARGVCSKRTVPSGN